MRFILLLLVCFPNLLFAQHNVVDSLLLELSKAKTDSAKVYINCSLGKHYLNSDAIKAKHYAHTAEKLAATTGFAMGKAKAFNLQGNAHLVLGEFDKSMAYQYRALEIGRQIKDTSTLIASYTNLGNVYLKIKDNARAEKNYLQAVDLATKAKDQVKLGKAYNNLGNVFEEKGEYQQALGYYNRALKIQEELHDKSGWAVSLLNIGNAHILLGQPKKGLPYLFNAVRLNEEIGNTIIKMACLGKVSEAFRVLGNGTEAVKYAQQSFDMAVETKSSKKIAEAAQQLHITYSSLKDYPQAYHYLQIFNKHKEIINAESRTKIESELTAKYETRQKEFENQELKEDKAQQAVKIELQQKTLVLQGMAVLLLTAFLVALYISKRRGKRAYKKLQEAHTLLEQQQAQIILQKNELCAQSNLLTKQNTQLEQHNSFKDKIFSIISHDLRAPLGSLRSILKMTQTSTLSGAELNDILKLLGREIEATGDMLDNVLIWAKAQLEGSRIQLQSIRLHELVEEHLQLIHSYAEKKNIIVTNKTPLETIVLADRERLSFVLRNLLMNAVKFSYTGGTITIEAKELDQTTSILVQDAGKGIPTDTIGKLFTQRRFTTPGTSGEKGTGIGLMLCKELVESFGGTMAVTSHVGNGSTFSVSLPMGVTLIEADPA